MNRFDGKTKAEILAHIEMTEDALSDPDNPIRETLTALLAELKDAKPFGSAKIIAAMEPAHDFTIDSLGRRRQQYGQGGAYVISPKQLAFLKKLLDERDRTGYRGTVPDDLAHASKKQVSRLIDDLLQLPLKPSAQAAAPKASEKQVNFVKKLLAEKDLSFKDGMEFVAADLAHTLTAKQASALIEVLLTLPRKPQQKAAAEELESGMCTNGTTIFKIYKAVHGSGRMCAKELVQGPDDAWTFEYRGLATRFITSAFHRMTLDEAKSFGAIYGVCCNCGRTLTDEVSIEAGIGPVCAKRFA